MIGVNIMALSKGTVKFQCPSCSNTLSLSGVRGAVTISCPHCGKKIKVTAQGEPPLSDGYSRERDEEELDLYEKDIRFFDRWPMIKNIVIKDVMALKKWLIVLFIVGIIFGALMIPQANSVENANSNKLDDANADGVIDPLEGAIMHQEELDLITSFYAIIVLFTTIILLLIVSHTYGYEVKRGTMRSLCLYSIDMNGLTMAKIISTALIFGLIQLFILVIPLSPFNSPMGYPWMTSVLGMVYVMNLLIIITGAFGSHIITFLTGKLYLSMNRLIVIMAILYIFLTETIFTIIGSILSGIRNLTADEADELVKNYSELGQALGNLSPYHSGGRMVTNSLGHNTGGADIAVVLLIGLILIIGGYVLGKKIYLDVFIRE
jgi:predicted RNA-binding Zn-ribbon protein involved in translation (DUF1610 family)/uncharacterized protein YpmB